MIYTFENNRLEYEAYGSGRTTLLFLPPGVGSMDHFRECVQEFSRNYRVVVVNMPGVGQSVFAPGKSNLDTISKTIVQLLKTLGARKTVIIAESYGTLIAVRIARLRLVHKLILLAPGIQFKTWIARTFQLFFAPAFISASVRRIAARILNRFRFFYIELHTVSDDHLRSISERWRELLYLKYDFGTKLRLSVTVFTGESLPVFSDRLTFLQQFDSSTVYCVPASHFSVLRHLSKHKFRTLYRELRSA